MRYHALKEEGIAIGSGVVEAANKTLVTQRMKRSGGWRIVGGQAVLTFRALGRFERAWKALIAQPTHRPTTTSVHVQQPWRCLNSTNQAADITAMRDSHPSGPVTSSTGIPESAVPGDAGSVGTGGFHSYTKQLAMRAEPAKHRPVAGSGGGERFGTKHRSVVAHDGGGVQVLVGVDATDDLDVVGCCRRHVRRSMMGGGVGSELSRCRNDSDGAPKAGLSSGPMSVEVGTSTGWPTCPGNDISVDLSVGQAIPRTAGPISLDASVAG